MGILIQISHEQFYLVTGQYSLNRCMAVSCDILTQHRQILFTLFGNFSLSDTDKRT